MMKNHKRRIIGMIVCMLMLSTVFYAAAEPSTRKITQTNQRTHGTTSTSLMVNDSRYWAILICGSDDFNAGFETDMRDMYQLLTTDLGYNPDYIYYVAPSNWNSAPHYYSVSKTNIQVALYTLANRTTPQDNVFVFFNGHGTHDPWTIAPGVSPAELDSWLDTIDPCWLYGLPRYCQQMVILLQSCYCGGFIQPLTYHMASPTGVYHRQRIVITSANSTAKSWEDMLGYADDNWDPNRPNDDGNPNNPSNGNWDGSEFCSGFRMAYRDTDSDTFLEADDNPYMKQTGYNPDLTAPSGNKNGKVSVKESFNFTKYVDDYSVYWASYCTAQGYVLESPQLWDPIIAGDPQGINSATIFIYTHAPAKPTTPAGETNGGINQVYTYTSSATDPDNDQVSYWFDWGDGTNSGWLGPVNSGASCSATHSWTTKGTYQIKVKAKDIHGRESNWSDPLPITMPKHLWFESRFPFLWHILQLLTTLLEQ